VRDEQDGANACARRMNRIRPIWSEQRTAIVGWLHVPSAFAAEALSRCGYDALVMTSGHTVR